MLIILLILNILSLLIIVFLVAALDGCDKFEVQRHDKSNLDYLPAPNFFSKTSK